MSEPCIVVQLDESELHVCVCIPNAILLLAQARPRMIQHLSSSTGRCQILLSLQQLLELHVLPPSLSCYAASYYWDTRTQRHVLHVVTQHVLQCYTLLLNMCYSVTRCYSTCVTVLHVVTQHVLQCYTLLLNMCYSVTRCYSTCVTVLHVVTQQYGCGCMYMKMCYSVTCCCICWNAYTEGPVSSPDHIWCISLPV